MSSKSKIYSRSGDSGETSLADSSRVAKDSLRVEAYGTVDECNSWVGIARSCTDHPVLAESLDFLQHRLFNCASNLATPSGAKRKGPKVSEADVAFLERAIDHFEGKTGPLTSFVLPTGSSCASSLHVARTVCRRAERRLVHLGGAETVDPLVMKFINRASDFLFAAARYSNHFRSHKEMVWDPECQPPLLPGEIDKV